MLSQYLIRSLLIAAGNQWFIIHGMDLVLIRRKKLIWIQLFMLFKTFMGVLLSFAATVCYPADPSWTMAYYLMDSILTAAGFAFFTYTFSDDPAYVLGFLPIMEGLGSVCVLGLALINMLERRETAFEAIGPVQLPDLLLPFLTIGLFYLLRPVLSRLLHIIARMYQPHRSLQIMVAVTIYLASRIPMITDKSIGSMWGIILLAHALFILAIGAWLIRSDFRAQKQEKNLLNMQLGLLERRAYLTSQISGKVEKLLSELSEQMQQLQTDVNSGNKPDRETLENYVQKLRELRIEKPRGIYCEDVLVDEVLTQIHEEAVSRGMNIRIHLRGYESGKVPEEDLVQILYYLWNACISEGGTLDIEMFMTGKELMIRFTSSMIRITRGKNTAIRSIARRYQGQVRVKMTGNKHVSVWLKIPDQTI